MKKKVGARVLSLLLSCVLLGTMLPAAVASADPADPTYSITVAPPSIDLVEGDEGELTAKVVSESTDGTKTELDDAGLAVSYTHLDVYKRQACAPTPIWTTAPPRGTA